MTLKHFLVEERGSGIRVLKVNRPEALNALNTETMVELRDYLRLAAHDPNLAVLILTGSGEKAFISGADIGEMREMSPSDAVLFSRLGHHVALELETMPKVTIAAVNGFALGGGTEIALACDFVIAAENAVFGLPETTLGVLPGFGGTIRLAKAIGTRRAKELIFSGRRVRSDEALSAGIANHVVPKQELLDKAVAIAETIARNSMRAVLKTKRLLNEFSESGGLSYKIDSEIHAFAGQFGSHDQKEGMAAFAEKRKARFEGASA